jgi:hypothetical protein
MRPPKSENPKRGGAPLEFLESTYSVEKLISCAREILPTNQLAAEN